MTSIKTYLIICALPFLMCATPSEYNSEWMMNTSSVEDFSNQWKQVEDFEKKGRPESALEIVEKIQSKAKSGSIKDQIIKTIIYKAKLIQEIKEDGEIAAIEYVESEYNTAIPPVKSILASQLAQVYKGYLDQRSWQIRQRTSEEKVDLSDKDIRTWTIEQFSDKIADLHLFATSDDRLQKFNLEDYLSILNDGDGRALRPSVYDLLVHRAIDYFGDTRSMLTEPIHAFHIDKEYYWSQAKSFVKL